MATISNDDDIQIFWDKKVSTGFRALGCGCIMHWDIAPDKESTRTIELCQEHHCLPIDKVKELIEQEIK